MRQSVQAVSHPDALVRAVRALRADLDEVVDDCVQTCVDRVPELADPDLRTTLRRSCEENISSMLQLLETEEAVDRDRMPEAAFALARDLVHLGAEREALQQGYRVGHHWFQTRVIAAAAAEATSAEELHAVTVRITDWCFSWFDTMHGAMAAAHAAEEALWRPSGAALRAAAIGSVLDGSCDDVDAASLTLGYDLRRDHVAAIAWHDTPANAINLRSVVTRALGGGVDARLLVHEASSSAVWVWLPAATARRSVQLVDKVHLALGEARHGAEGFRRSHEDAESARRMTMRRGEPAPTVCAFRDIEFTALMTADRGRSDAFVREALGPLAATDPSTQRLRETLVAVFEEPSIAAAAARLGVHHNTVVYRVRKAEELLGRDPNERRLHLQAALHMAEDLALFR